MAAPPPHPHARADPLQPQQPNSLNDAFQALVDRIAHSLKLGAADRLAQQQLALQARPQPLPQRERRASAPYASTTTSRSRNASASGAQQAIPRFLRGMGAAPGSRRASHASDTAPSPGGRSRKPTSGHDDESTAAAYGHPLPLGPLSEDGSVLPAYYRSSTGGTRPLADRRPEMTRIDSGIGSLSLAPSASASAATVVVAGPHDDDASPPSHAGSRRRGSKRGRARPGTGSSVGSALMVGGPTDSTLGASAASSSSSLVNPYLARFLKFASGSKRSSAEEVPDPRADDDVSEGEYALDDDDDAISAAPLSSTGSSRSGTAAAAPPLANDHAAAAAESSVGGVSASLARAYAQLERELQLSLREHEQRAQQLQETQAEPHDVGAPLSAISLMQLPSFTGAGHDALIDGDISAAADDGDDDVTDETGVVPGVNALSLDVGAGGTAAAPSAAAAAAVAHALMLHAHSRATTGGSLAGGARSGAASEDQDEDEEETGVVTDDFGLAEAAPEYATAPVVTAPAGVSLAQAAVAAAQWDAHLPHYAGSVFAHLLAHERRTMPRRGYMSGVQTSITPDLRDNLVDYLVGVRADLHLARDSVFLAVNYVDRFLSAKNVTPVTLDSACLAALLIATKYEEVAPPDVTDIARLLEHQFTPEDLLDMERELLAALKFKLNAVTPDAFLPALVHAANAAAATPPPRANGVLAELNEQQPTAVGAVVDHIVAQHILWMAVADYDCAAAYPPSVLAAAATLVAAECSGDQLAPAKHAPPAGEPVWRAVRHALASPTSSAGDDEATLALAVHAVRRAAGKPRFNIARCSEAAARLAQRAREQRKLRDAVVAAAAAGAGGARDEPALGAGGVPPAIEA